MGFSPETLFAGTTQTRASRTGKLWKRVEGETRERLKKDGMPADAAEEIATGVAGVQRLAGVWRSLQDKGVLPAFLVITLAVLGAGTVGFVAAENLEDLGRAW